MNNFFALFSKNQSLIYKGFLFILSTFLVIYLLPKGGHFKYNFQKGKPWQYENLYAPFSFTIKKDSKTLEEEKETIKENATPYFEYNEEIVETRKEDFLQLFNDAFVDSLYTTSKKVAQNEGLSVFTELYDKGVIDEVYPYDEDKLIYLKRGNEIEELAYSQFFRKENIKGKVAKLVSESATEDVKTVLQKVLERAVVPNVTLNTKLTEASVESEINAINPNRGVVEKGGRIIAKGEVVEGDTYQILNSLKAEYQSQVWSKSN
ncbi:MAG TPA: phosphohydrolase, partial [Flavobacteriaceae bacterium]|nr:phosphohydrolase [Flavobacteriaceae bacterium]